MVLMGADAGNKVRNEAAPERRNAARLPVEMWVEDLTDGGQVWRRAGNLSRGGIYLDQTIPMPIGTAVKLRLTLPEDDEAITVSGTIVSIATSQTFGMGVKFVDVDPKTQARLDGFVERRLTPAASPVT
jgi:uncharacterized protein (TIGR02266 family)